MSIKKKIVIVISIISVMIFCFGINSFAFQVGDVIPAGSKIVFKETISNNPFTQNVNFISNGVEFTKFQFTSAVSVYYYTDNTTSDIVYSNSNWINDSYRTILLKDDLEINLDTVANYFNRVVEEVIEPKNLPKSFWESVSGFFSEALASGTAIVNWMTITPIALIPLALYCLIVIIAITKRMIKG